MKLLFREGKTKVSRRETFLGAYHSFDGLLRVLESSPSFYKNRIAFVSRLRISQYRTHIFIRLYYRVCSTLVIDRSLAQCTISLIPLS